MPNNQGPDRFIMSLMQFLENWRDPRTRRSYVDYYQNLPDYDDELHIRTSLVFEIFRLLGYDPSADFVHDLTGAEGRPDVVVRLPLGVGKVFVVETKPSRESHLRRHLPQLRNYASGEGTRMGILANGDQLLAWDFVADPPAPLVALPLHAILQNFVTGFFGMGT